MNETYKYRTGVQNAANINSISIYNCINLSGYIEGEMMRILICGDRNWSNREVIKNYIYSVPIDTVIIEGEARGADIIAREIAEERGMTVLKYSAKWERYGNSAGPIRNSTMIKDGKPDTVVAFHNDLSKSKGTIDMLTKAHNKGIFCVVVDSNGRMVEYA